MRDYPDLCNDEPSCCKPDLTQRIAELEAAMREAASKRYFNAALQVLAEALGDMAGIDGTDVTYLLNHIAELEAEPARLQEILLKQTKLNTRVINEKIELEARIEELTAYSEAVAEVVSEDTFQKIEANYNLRLEVQRSG